MFILFYGFLFYSVFIIFYFILVTLSKVNVFTLLLFTSRNYVFKMLGTHTWKFFNEQYISVKKIIKKSSEVSLKFQPH